MATNHITVAGNLTRDPELRYTQGGKGVCNLGLAVSHRFQQNGEWVEKPTYYDVTVWGEQGENVAASCSKGTRMIVTGRMESRPYEDKKGDKRTAWDLIADEVAPSLRWARCTVDKVARTQSDEPSGQAGRPPAEYVSGEEF